MRDIVCKVFKSLYSSCDRKKNCHCRKRIYHYTRKRGNHFYQCFMQFYIILIHKFVVSRSFKIRFWLDLSNYRSFGLLTLQTIDPSDHWPFGLMKWHEFIYVSQLKHIHYCKISQIISPLIIIKTILKKNKNVQMYKCLQTLSLMFV